MTGLARDAWNRVRTLRHLWRLRRSGLFDPTWYAARHPEAGRDVGRHFLSNRADPGPLFSVAAYLAVNRDVAGSDVNPLLHYLLDGWSQGRPVRPGPHPPPRLPSSAVLDVREQVQTWLRPIRPRRRLLRAVAGPDPATTIRIRPAHGAMPTGWCLLSSDSDADLLVVTGGQSFDVTIPAAPASILVQLPAVPPLLAVRRRDRPGPGAAARPVVRVTELGAVHAWIASRRIASTRLADATSYAAWIERYDKPTQAQSETMAERAARLKGPRFAIRGHHDGDGVATQSYRNWHVGPPAAGEYIVRIDRHAALAPHALLLLAEALVNDPGIDLIYADQDRIADGVRSDPWFKPDYSAERQHAQDLFGAFGVARADGLDQPGDLPDWTRLATGRNIHHVPHVLAHTTRPPHIPSPAAPDLAGPWPTVTAIVPTRDHADILRVCLYGLLDHTDYPALEIIVADNDSTSPEALAVLDQARGRGVTILSCPGRFNYSAINNRAATVAHGALLLFLNNDISMPRPDWLRHMVRLARRPGIGAVGAKLLYPDGTLQHGGVIAGMGGVAGHVHQGTASDDAGYGGRLRVTQEVSAVTAACMVVPAAAFAAVGGFDATHLPVAFNDIDLCLRLRRAGLRVLWTPDAVLTHWESKSRASDFSADRIVGFTAEIATMQERWSAELAADPFFSPNVSLETTDAAWAFPPRTPRPWE